MQAQPATQSARTRAPNNNTQAGDSKTDSSVLQQTRNMQTQSATQSTLADASTRARKSSSGSTATPDPPVMQAHSTPTSQSSRVNTPEDLEMIDESNHGPTIREMNEYSDSEDSDGEDFDGEPLTDTARLKIVSSQLESAEARVSRLEWDNAGLSSMVHQLKQKRAQGHVEAGIALERIMDQVRFLSHQSAVNAGLVASRDIHPQQADRVVTIGDGRQHSTRQVRRRTGNSGDTPSSHSNVQEGQQATNADTKVFTRPVVTVVTKPKPATVEDEIKGDPSANAKDIKDAEMSSADT